MVTTGGINKTNFKVAAIITLVLAAILLTLSFVIGKDELFLLLNTNLGTFGDIVFNYGTHAGDGFLWLVWLVALLRKEMRRVLPLLLSTAVLSTSFTQLGKQVIYPDEYRPSASFKLSVLNVKEEDDITGINGVKISSIQELYRQVGSLREGDSVQVAYLRKGQPDTSDVVLKKSVQLHLVEGVDVHTYSSFPSGHTATAFCFALLISLLVRTRRLALIALLVAALVGYSRIYLSQHYPLDVGAGMLVAVISVSIAVLVQDWFDKRWNRDHR